ncbi:hypothetical protein [Desulfosporosinus sp. SB140]|uniref:hypothetical protein n=1 Tax=Desulfosporosinus paludis TaxID=3115649 RepID=UPI00388DEA60
MTRLAVIYIFVELILIIFAVITFVVWDKRYRKNHGIDVPRGFEKTEEVSLDPNSGEKLRVYFNSKTGERFYHTEK